MRVQPILILYQFVQAASALFTVRGIHVRGVKAEVLSKYEYDRDYGQNISIIHQVIDQPTSNKVCPQYQDTLGGQGDLIIDASPGSLVEVQYLEEQLPRPDHNKRGFITWYGVWNSFLPNNTTFGDIIDIQEGRKGDVLAGLYSHNALFHIPPQLAYGDTYTLYWIWNTTYLLNGGFLLFTSCINVNIVDNSTTVAPIIEPRHLAPGVGTSTALGTTISITSKKPSMSEQKKRVSFHGPRRPITLQAWETHNCTGPWAYTSFDSENFMTNNSNYYISRSFRLSRPLESQEQLDLSHATNYSAWYNTRSQALQSPNPACDIFDQSYFAWNSSTDCYSTTAFTCHRLWINSGLPL